MSTDHVTHATPAHLCVQRQVSKYYRLPNRYRAGRHAPTRATSCGGHEVPCHPSDPFKIKMVAQPPLAASSNLGSQEIVLHAITSVAPDAAALAMHPSRMDRNNMATISFLNAELPWMRRNLLQHEATNVWTYGVEGMAPDCAEQGRALSSRLTA